MISLRRLCFVMGAALLSASSYAQITITQADFARIFTAGTQIVNRTDTVATQVDVGTPGGGNQWDFRNFLTHTFQVYNNMTPGSTPSFRSNFPTATHAVRLDTTINDPIPAGLVNIFQYLELRPNSLINLGNMAQKMVFISLGELRTIVNPAEVVYQLPLASGTTWNTAFSNTVQISLGGQIVSTSVTSHNATYTVDGYGRMRLPGNTEATYALRLRKANLYTNAQGTTFPIVSFVFISKGGALVQVVAADTSARQGVIPIERKSLIWNYAVAPDSTTDVRVSDAIPSAFALKQNYPNPFNPSTNIAYDIPGTEFVSLKVYNMLGQEVATLVNDVRSAGSYEAVWDAANMPSGMYFYKLRSGSFSETRRMLLLK